MLRKDYSIAVLHILVCVMMVWCLFSLVSRLDDDVAFVKDVNDMWSIDLIERFYREKCEECVAWSGVYEGTNDGCYCTTSHHRKKVQRGLHTGSCNWNQTSVGCLDIEQIPLTTVATWSQNNTVFVKRRPNSSYSSLVNNMDKEGDCKPGFRLCEYRKMPEGGVCVPEEWSGCPMSAVYIEDGDAEVSPDNASREKFNGFSLVQLHDPSELPITELRLAESHICRNQWKTATTEGRPAYSLNRKAREHCPRDERYQELDSIGEQQLFDLHEIDYQRLVGFKTSDFYRWKRMYRRLQPIFPHCKSIFVSMKSLAGKMSVYYYSIYIFSIAWVLLVLVTLVCRYFILEAVSQAGQKDIFASKVFFRIFAGALLVMGVLWFLSWSCTSQLYQIEQLKCGDEGINSTLASMSEASKTDGSFYLLSLLLCVLVLVWDQIASSMKIALNRGRFVDEQGRYMRDLELPQIEVPTILTFASIIAS